MYFQRRCFLAFFHAFISFFFFHAATAIRTPNFEGRIREDAPNGTLVTLHPEFDSLLRKHHGCLIHVLHPPTVENGQNSGRNQRNNDKILDTPYFRYDPSKLTLKSVRIIDRQIGEYYEVPVAAFCAADRTSVQWMVIIRVSQSNRHPPVFERSQYTFWTSRSAPVGATVGYVKAHDEDVVIYNSMVSYKLVITETDDQQTPTRAAFYEVDGESGAVRLATALQDTDRTVASGPFGVEACDYGSPRKCDVASVEVITVKPEAPTNVTLTTNDSRYHIVCWSKPSLPIEPDYYTLQVQTVYADSENEDGGNYSIKVTNQQVTNSTGQCVVVDADATRQRNRTVHSYEATVAIHIGVDEAKSGTVASPASKETLSCNGTCLNNGTPACEPLNANLGAVQFHMDNIPYCLCPARFDGNICQNERYCDNASLQSEYGRLDWKRTAVDVAAEASCPFGPDGVTVTRTCAWDASRYTTVWTPVTGLNECLTLEDYRKATSIVRVNESTQINGSQVLNALSMLMKSAETIATDQRLTNRMVEFINYTVATDLSQWPEKEEIGAKIKALLTIYTKSLPVAPGSSSTVRSENMVVTVTKAKTGLSEPIAMDVGKEAKVEIPRCVVDQAALSTADPRISAIWLRDDKIFGYSDNNQLASSPDQRAVLLIVVEGIDNEQELLGPIAFSLTLPYGTGGQHSPQATCVYWQESKSRWSSRGVKTLGVDESNRLASCETSHLTGFSILLDFEPYSKVDPSSRKMLNLLSWIGCGCSILALFLTIVTYSLFPCLHSDHVGKVLINLCTSMLCLNAVFILSSLRPIGDYRYSVCVATAVLLHYFTLTTLLWMGVEAANMYQMLVHVFASTERLYVVKRCIVAWGLPLVTVLVTLFINNDHYFDPSDDYCRLSSRYPSVQYGVFLGPACVVLLLNCTGFAFVLKVLTQTHASTPIVKQKAQAGGLMKYSTMLAQVRGALSVMVLLGVTWILGAFAVGPVRLPFMYAFCLLNSLQGFITFLVRCLCYDEARRAWCMLLRTGKLKQQRGKSMLEFRFSGSCSSTNRVRLTTTTSSDIFARPAQNVDNGGKMRTQREQMKDQADNVEVNLMPRCWKYIDDPSTPNLNSR